MSIPLRALLVAPTVAQLAVLVRRQDAAVRYPAAVPVQPLGTQRPLFLVPGAGGNATQFYALGRHLGEDQPLYVLEGRGRDGGEDPHLSIADMVAYGIEVMRHVQPAGPYALLGYSVGGLVAFEMANELERTGHEVAFLGILDTANPTMVPTLRRTVERRVALVRDLGLAAFLARSRRHLGFRVHTVRDHFRRTLAYHRHRRRGQGIPESVLEAYLFMVHRRAFFQHRPRPFSGRVVLFRTKDQPAHFPADLGWGGLAAGGVEVREVKGDHLALLTEPTVQGLASVIGEHLPGGAEARL